MPPVTLPKSFPSQADPAAVVTGPGVRFTVLTSRLIRLEYSQGNAFEDRASQAFWYRHQPAPPSGLTQTPEQIEIETEHLLLRYAITPDGFTDRTLSIRVKALDVTWRFGAYDRHNLRGTACTLDNVDGAVPLEPGLVSRAGWALVDDSRSLVFDGEGWLVQRPATRDAEYRDLYFFGHGHDYIGCLQTMAGAGPCPMLPRYVLGNWWSRYWAYRQDELRDLMVEFRARSAARRVHHRHGLAHHPDRQRVRPAGRATPGTATCCPTPGLPRAGCTRRACAPRSTCIPRMASGRTRRSTRRWRAHGAGPAAGEPVHFDLADPRSPRAISRSCTTRWRQQGVDFWWLDWQQGRRMIHSQARGRGDGSAVVAQPPALL